MDGGGSLERSCINRSNYSIGENGMAARTGKGETPLRAIRVNDADWQAWAEAAEALGVTRSQLLRFAVSRVVRARQSANNAASDLFELLGNAAQRSGPEGRRGGEAEEAPRPESTAKPGGLRSN